MIKNTLNEVLADLDLRHLKLKIMTREAFEMATQLEKAVGPSWDIYVAAAYMATLRIVANGDMTLDDFRLAQKMLEAATGKKFKRSGTGTEEGKASLEADVWFKSAECDDFIYICLRSNRTIGCKLRWEQEIRNVPILDPGCLNGVPDERPEIRSELHDPERERGAEETLGDSPAGGDAADVGAAGDQVRDGDRDPDQEAAPGTDIGQDENS